MDESMLVAIVKVACGMCIAFGPYAICFILLFRRIAEEKKSSKRRCSDQAETHVENQKAVKPEHSPV